MLVKLKSYDEFPALMGVKDLQQIIPLSRAGIYNLVNSSGFPIIKIGKRIVVPKEGLISWLEQNTTIEV